MSFCKRIEEYKKSPVDFQKHDAHYYLSIRKKLANKEMTDSERFFLNGVIRYFKPKKMLEIGVSAGSSTAVMLNAIRDMPETKLYSIDISKQCYREEEKTTGYIVSEQFPDLTKNTDNTDKWILKSGAMAHAFMDEIGNDIDFCFIDTAHYLPGEILDFLMVLPYLAKNAVLIMHDISLQTHMNPKAKLHYAASVLLGHTQGTRLIPVNTEYLLFPNIGGVILADTVREDMWPYFNALLLPWDDWYYNESNWESVRKHLARYYSIEDMNFFTQILKYKDLQQYQINPTDFETS